MGIRSTSTVSKRINNTPMKDSLVVFPHLRGFGGGLGHVQGAASHANGGGGGEGSGRADEKRGNSKLHDKKECVL